MHVRTIRAWMYCVRICMYMVNISSNWDPNTNQHGSPATVFHCLRTEIQPRKATKEQIHPSTGDHVAAAAAAACGFWLHHSSWGKPRAVTAESELPAETPWKQMKRSIPVQLCSCERHKIASCERHKISLAPTRRRWRWAAEVEQNSGRYCRFLSIADIQIHAIRKIREWKLLWKTQIPHAKSMNPTRGGRDSRKFQSITFHCSYSNTFKSENWITIEN